MIWPSRSPPPRQRLQHQALYSDTSEHGDEQAGARARRADGVEAPAAGTEPRVYVVGRANARLTKGAVGAVIALVVILTALAVLRGAVVLPGFLFFYYLWRSIWPLRGVMVAEQGLALVERSFFHARPRKILAMVSVSEVHINRVGRRGQIAIAGDLVSLQRDDYDLLVGSPGAESMTGLPA